MSHDVSRSHEPQDHLGRMADGMTDVVPENVKAIVMLQDGELGCVHLCNYEEDTEAITDMFIHLQAMFRSIGKELILMPISQN